MQTYREQYKRAKRFYERIQNQDRGSEEYEDDVWAFFQNAWHLKDWIKNDASVAQHIKGTIENDVKQYDAIMTCADLTNRSKHKTLTTPNRKDADISQKNIIVRFLEPLRLHKGEQDIKSEISYDFKIETTSGKVEDMLVVAKQIIEDWETYLTKNNLLP